MPVEQRYRPAGQGSPPIPVEQQNRLGDSGESTEMPKNHDDGSKYVEHFVVTNGVWRRIPVEQKYRPAEHGSKPIPVYDARDYGDHVYDIVPR